MGDLAVDVKGIQQTPYHATRTQESDIGGGVERLPLSGFEHSPGGLPPPPRHPAFTYGEGAVEWHEKAMARQLRRTGGADPVTDPEGPSEEDLPKAPKAA